MDASQQIKKRGGRRAGAGRPSTESKLYTFRAPKRMAQYIDMQENKTEFIKGCIAQGMANEMENQPFAWTWGKVYPMSRVQGGCLPFFDIGIVAGFPIPLDNDERAQDIDLLRMLCPYPESCYLIRVEGDSMIDAGISSGDIVIVDKSNRTPNESQVAVCEFNGEYTLKRFVKRNGVGWLVPANPDYPEIKVTEDDDFSVWGVVTYIIHKPRG
ncbi:MAG: translesion error-prone DNA polymerase V autoproteolytic subunit [Bacteroidaceae bacterium]|nr:translesion error-prone DNA polymerase V autoproteolytic subunit [Bacteroidaceae bacterium]